MKVLIIDNYDSFTYNIVQYLGELGAELVVHRNDQITLDEIIGNDNYDVGHLFDYGQPDGDAGCIGCVCESGLKGSGYSTHPFRDIFGGEYRNDYFDLDYVAHEIGHQFGAYHTFAFQTENSGSNVEPGSGSTIMGYAGITGEDDIQAHGDPYFHYVSIKEINNYVSNLSCTLTAVSIINDVYNSFFKEWTFWNKKTI